MDKEKDSGSTIAMQIRDGYETALVGIPDHLTSSEFTKIMAYITFNVKVYSEKTGELIPRREDVDPDYFKNL